MDAAEELDVAPHAGYPNAKDVCFASEANEIFFGVVGHVGSGTGFISSTLQMLLKKKDYQAEIIKASVAIRDWSTKSSQPDIPPTGGRSEIKKTDRMQTLGDLMRKSSQDYAAVAQGIVALIRNQRALWKGEKQAINGQPVEADPKSKRAYIIDSIRHPAEVKLLRLIYGDAFALVGVVCEESVRRDRLVDKYFEWDDRDKDDAEREVTSLMERDSDDKKNEFGQHVADAFWESDYFVDNTSDRAKQDRFSLNEMLGRLIDIVTHGTIVRPTIAETGMHVAVSAQIRSACLSKQVGAAIVDFEGNILAVGANDVPKAGGGSYRAAEGHEGDSRCFVCEDPHCSSNAEQNALIQKLLQAFPKLGEEGDPESIVKRMRKAGLGGILEFSRAIHAEMDALTTAARRGISVRGASMYVTAFPCHYCARHIVAAGIDEVQFIEPYPKSRALDLHGDSITQIGSGWIPPSALPEKDEDEKRELERLRRAKEKVDEKPFHTVGDVQFGRDDNKRKVLFRPFVGVAPRLYQRAFTKDRSLKDNVTGKLRFGEPEWGGKWGVRMLPYTDLEARLTEEQDK